MSPGNINKLPLEGHDDAWTFLQESSVAGRRSVSILFLGQGQGSSSSTATAEQSGRRGGEGKTVQEQEVWAEITFLWVKWQQLSMRRWRYVERKLDSSPSQSNSSWVKTSTARNMKPLKKRAHHTHIHHNSCYIKAMITTASWLSISVYLWCITHFNAILLQWFSCHCSVFGWEGEKKNNPCEWLQCTVCFPWRTKGQMHITFQGPS